MVGRSVARSPADGKYFSQKNIDAFSFNARSLSLLRRALERDLLCTVGIMDEGDNMCAINNKAYVQE